MKDFPLGLVRYKALPILEDCLNDTAIVNEVVIRPHVKTRTQSGKLEGNLYFSLSP